MINRKDFIKISGGTAASLLVGGRLAAAPVEEKYFEGFPLPPKEGLFWLEANPPEGTKAVRFFIDDMQVAELTDLYSLKMKTKPVWKTCIDPMWLSSGEH